MIDSIAGAAAQDLLSTSERADQAFIEELNSEKARKQLANPGIGWLPSQRDEGQATLRLQCYEATRSLEEAQELYAWVSGEGK